MANNLDTALKDNYPGLSDRQRTDLVVKILYGSETDVGAPPKPWAPSADPSGQWSLERQKTLFDAAQTAVRISIESGDAGDLRPCSRRRLLQCIRMPPAARPLPARAGGLQRPQT